MSTRTLAVWCQDWPVVAASAVAGLAVGLPVGVLAGGHVAACSAQARAEGVRKGMRRRDAQGRCPELIVFPDDPARDARLFEVVASAVEELAVGVEVVRPGLVAVPAKGPAGYLGSEEAAAERLVDHVATRAGVECQVGIADGLFAATLAAHRGLLVEPGASPDFLAPLGIWELTRLQDTDERNELVDLLRRLGLGTLGAFAAVPERDVATRFGADAVLAHRLARGAEKRPPSRRTPPPDLVVVERFDPPVDRVDAVAFAARGLAATLHGRLAAHGMACTRLSITATSEGGEERSRVWRSADPLTPAAIADRVRWQLDGWLRGGPGVRPSGGIDTLRVEPEEIVDGQVLQLHLWQAGNDDNSERAARAMVRVQSLLGPESVATAVLEGGRGPADQVRLVPWGDERDPRTDPGQPWPGKLPAPSPSIVPATPIPVEVFDSKGKPVCVTNTHGFTGEPAAITVMGEPKAVLGWAGPWPVDEHWWVQPANRRSRMQVVIGDEEQQRALLLVAKAGTWTVEGIYD